MQWIVLKSVSEGRVALPFTMKQIVPCFEQRSQGYIPFLVCSGGLGLNWGEVSGYLAYVYVSGCNCRCL